MTLHPIRKYNENYYIKVRPGDTFKSIGKEIGISGRKIAKWNEREYHDRLQVGEIIWLKKKQKRAPKQYKNHPHLVNDGESLVQHSAVLWHPTEEHHQEEPAAYGPSVPGPGG